MKKLIIFFLLFITILASQQACNIKQPDAPAKINKIEKKNLPWYFDTVFYHIFIKSFADSNDNDQVGDIKGIIEKLDYLNDGNPNTNSDLGITGIILSPFYESARKSINPQDNIHGYDVIDYYKVNSLFGSKNDLKKLIKEANKRNIKIIFDFVPNYTSTLHPWFIDSKNGGKKRNWYMWDKKPSKDWKPSWGKKSWDAVWKYTNGSYFFTFFQTKECADLNLQNRQVINELNKVMRYWLDIGFAGMRVDAAKFLVEEGPLKQYNTPSTHALLKEYRQILNSYTPPKVMIAEASSSAQALKEYYGNGKDELHMSFGFPFAGAVLSSVSGVKPDSVNDLIEYERKNYPVGYRTANIISNHDVFFSRPYTQYNENAKKCVLAAAFNILSNGTPVIYYGNEVGMKGYRTPDVNLRKVLNWKDIERQSKDANSLLSWYKYLIQIRNKYNSIKKGDHLPIKVTNKNTTAFLRSYDLENIIVVINPSNKIQTTKLNLSNLPIPFEKIQIILGEANLSNNLTNDNISSFKIENLHPNSLLVLYVGNKLQNKIYTSSKKINAKTTDMIFNIKYSSMFLRGSMNNWAGDIAMKRTGKNLWQTTVLLNKGNYEYKFEISGKNQWQVNWGNNENDNIADVDGQNISIEISEKGKYKFTFDEKTKKYSVSLIHKD